MKKQITLAIAAALSLSVVGTALAAPTNPFIDVPANHWSYDAVQELQKDGVISGYGDGTFRGDRTLTRYEMAAMIAKITDVDGKHEALVKKLQAEFAVELYNLGIRVDALEKNASTIKFTGDAALAYERGMIIGGEQAGLKSNSKNASNLRQEINLNLEANITDNVDFYGRITAENISNSREVDGNFKESSSGNMAFDLAEFRWNNKNFTLSTGRLNPFLGQGLIWGGDNPADGILMGYNFGRVNLEAGYLDLAPTVDVGPSVNAFVANMGIEVNDKINLTAAYLDTTNPKNSVSTFGPDGYAFKQWAVGANANLGSDFKLSGEYIKNSDAPVGEQDKGAWGRLQWREIDDSQPGTYSIYLDYLKLGNWAVDSSTFGHDLNVAGGNGIGGAGAKGWGLGVQYVFAKNANVELNYYDLKSYNGDFKYKKSYSVTTNFLF